MKHSIHEAGQLTDESKSSQKHYHCFFKKCDININKSLGPPEKGFSASTAHDIIMAENLKTAKDGKYFEASANRQITPNYNFIRR